MNLYIGQFLIKYSWIEKKVLIRFQIIKDMNILSSLNVLQANWIELFKFTAFFQIK